MQSHPLSPAGWSMPSAADSVLRDVLDLRAAQTPDACFARFQEGSSWSFAETRSQTRRAAAGLQKLGVKQGDTVLFWVPSGAEGLRLWFAINYLGAVLVPINLAYRGLLLEHVIRNSGARLMLAHASLVARLADVQHTALRDVVCVDGAAAPVEGLALHDAAVLESAGEDPIGPLPPVMPWDLQQIIYTSGTTGPSKGVMCSYFKIQAADPAFSFLGPEDRYLVNLPFFHISGTGVVMHMLRRGGSVAIVDAFSTTTFWKVVRDTGATCCTLIGAMATLLAKAEPHPEDRGHGLRSVVVLPLSEEASAFAARFGCDVYTVFNMTETACPIFSGPNPQLSGSCGRASPGIEARIVDENDYEVPHGVVGELVLRSNVPWSISQGYFNAPEATAKAWRNGWFHTGDAFRSDAVGNFFFVDRIKDAIRRRGENISSFEVELEVCAHPAVREAAAYAVPAALGDEEVMVAIVLKEGRTLPWPELAAFLAARMARFMQPRYFRRVPELPKTPTLKVQKMSLRSEGITPDTFDRMAAEAAA